MKSITFHCEVITPMFLSGADGTTPELRPPSIKGAMHFWWRAMNGHLKLPDLKKEEDEIFGGGGENAGRSNIIIEVLNQPTDNDKFKTKPLPHKEKTFVKEAIQTGFEFKIKIGIQNESNGFDLEKAKNLFIVFSLLGGLGNRSRRGFGSFKITKINNIDFKSPQNNEDINKLINSTNSQLKNKKGQYPYYIKHQIGNTLFNDVTKAIGETTNKFHKRYGYDYDNAMGKAKGGRMASPVYVSVIEKTNNKLYPIITTLHTALKNNTRFDKDIQKEFIKSLL